MSTDIPKRQRAAVRVVGDATKLVSIQTIDVPSPGPSQILVKITWTGVCGTDKTYFLGGFDAPTGSTDLGSGGIAGHEGVGVVVAVGQDAGERWSIGDRAGVKWIASVCGDCEFCQEGHDMHCPNHTQSGLSRPGTFQEYCLADGRYSTKIPDGVPDEEAAPILCGGVTTYAACKKSGVGPGQWIVIPGAGGGLGHIAVQYAKAMGMRVIAIDTGDQKRQLCERLGAEVFIDFKTSEDVAAEVRNITRLGAHGVLVIAASRQAFATAPGFLRPGGTVVAVGIPTDPSIMAGATPSQLISGQLKIVGSLVGGRKDVDEAFDFAARGLIHPVVCKGKLEDLDTWIRKLEAGEVAGRIVLQVSQYGSQTMRKSC
ncbi:hypothetical protein ACJZ2D_014075 [Fusarium nematophilum]